MSAPAAAAAARGALSTRTRVLRLYRSLLKHAERFPSKKRGEIVEEIKVEFRAGRRLTDPELIDQGLQRSMKGLEHMQQFVQLDPSKAIWTVKM